MDAFIDSTIQLLIEWGLPGLFISALLAGSIVPFSSELVLVALVKLGLPPTACLISAALGNTVGGMTCYYMGRLGKISWKQYMAYGSFHVCRQVDTLHPSPVCAGKCMECGSRINVSLSNQAISIR